MQTVELMDYEFQALVDAVRRDYRLETEKSFNDNVYGSWHGQNARMNIRLLELLKPKNIQEAAA